MGVKCYLFKTGNCYRELIYVCEPRKVVRWQGLFSRPCTMLGKGKFEKKDKYKGVNDCLQVWINLRAFCTSRILLKLYYCASKRGCFGFSLRGTKIQDKDEKSRFFEEQKQEGGKKNIYKGEVFLTEIWNKLKSSKLRCFKNT